MKCIYWIALISVFCACNRIKQTEDNLYSRHLQRNVKLRILYTPPPSDRNAYNLLVLNDGQDINELQVKNTMNSLYKSGKISPLVIVGVEAGDRFQEFGVADKPDYTGIGIKASFYDAFINNELFPYVKKKSGVRKFQSMVIAGWSLGGLSAFDIAWNHPDKFSKVGVFSGSFWVGDKSTKDSSYSDEKNRIMYFKIKTSRKKPDLQYWFYAGAMEEKSVRLKDTIVDIVHDTKDLISLLKEKNVVDPGGIVYIESATGKHDNKSWRIVFPDFLQWAFPAGK
jgi:enterochelin esterase-like enzyme